MKNVQSLPHDAKHSNEPKACIASHIGAHDTLVSFS